MRFRCLVFALALLAAFASDSWGQSKKPTPPPTQPAQTNQTPQPYERGTEQSPVIVKVSQTKESEEKAAADTRREDEKTANDWRLARFTELLFWATGALCIIALFQLFVFGWQGIQLMRSVSAAKEATELGNREFISSHRPELRLKHIWISSQNGQDFSGQLQADVPIMVRLDIANVGGTDAIIQLINLVTVVLEPNGRLPQRPPYNEPGVQQFPVGRFRLGRGITFTMAVSDGRVLNESDVDGIELGTKMLYFVGTVEYWDDLNALRQSAFCRRLEFSRDDSGHTIGRFVKWNDPDYEYQD